MEDSAIKPGPATPDQMKTVQHKSNLDRFIGIFSGTLGILLFCLQANGVEMNWKISLAAYTLIAFVCVYSCMRHAVPDRGAATKIICALSIFCTVGFLGYIGTIKQYRRDHMLRNAAKSLASSFPMSGRQATDAASVPRSKESNNRPAVMTKPIQNLDLLDCEPVPYSQSSGPASLHISATVSTVSSQKNGGTTASFSTDGTADQKIKLLRQPKRILVEPPGELVTISELPKPLRLGRCGSKVCKITIKEFASDGIIIDSHEARVIKKGEFCGVRMKITVVEAQ